MSFRGIMKVATPLSFIRSWGIRNQKYQRFTFGIRNNAGTMQCAFFGDVMNALTPPRPELCDRILWASMEWRNLPIVSGSVAFGNVGAAVHSSSQYLIFNTGPQAPERGILGWVSNAYYSGNVTRTTPYIYVDSFNVLGSGQFLRPTMLICNDLTAGFPLFTSAQFPSGTSGYWDFTMFLA